MQTRTKHGHHRLSTAVRAILVLMLILPAFSTTGLAQASGYPGPIASTAGAGVLDGPPLPLVTSSMERLTHLMERAEPILQAGSPADPSEPLLSPQSITAEGEPPVSIEPSKTDDDLAQR